MPSRWSPDIIVLNRGEHKPVGMGALLRHLGSENLSLPRLVTPVGGRISAVRRRPPAALVHFRSRFRPSTSFHSPADRTAPASWS